MSGVKIGAIPLAIANPTDFSRYCESAAHKGQEVPGRWAVVVIFGKTGDSDVTFTWCPDCMAEAECNQGHSLRLPQAGRG
jgi:hypothetical protein